MEGANMAFLEWNETFSTNIRQFDEDHKKMFFLLQNVYHQVFECKDLEEERELTERTLMELADYVAYHFSAEEKLMQQYQYPDYLAHKKEHAYYIGEVNKLLDQHKRGAVALSFPTFMTLKDWINKHILIRDKKYETFFKDRGIE